MSKKIAVLVSRKGSLLKGIQDDPDITISLVVADRECPALQVAKSYNLPTEVVLRTNFTETFKAQRSIYTRQLIKVLNSHGIGIIITAGFMTVLSREFFERYQLVFGCHPAPLPRFKGLHAVRDTLCSERKRTGPTIGLVGVDTDRWNILYAPHEAVPILEGDTVESLHERIKEVERGLYPRVIKEYLARYVSG